MANEKELNPSPKFPTGVKPELSPNPNFSDGLKNRTNEEPNTQVVTEKKVQPIKDLTIEQIIAIIKKREGSYVTEDELEDKVNDIIDDSLVSGDLKTVLQNKSLSVSDFPLTSDIDNQHSTVNAGLLPNGDMSSLTESDISKLTLTLNRIINKGWLKTGTASAIRLSKVLYNADLISITAETTVFSGEGGVLSGQSYLITLDVANATYDYAVGSYN